MVAAAILASVVTLCASALVAFRWQLTAKTQHSPVVELEKRLSDVEARLRGAGVAQMAGRTHRNVG